MQKPLRRPLLLLSLVMLPLLAVGIATQLSLRQHQEEAVHANAMRLLDGVEAEQQRLVDDVHHILGTLATAAAPQLTGSNCQTAMDGLREQLPPYLIVEVMGLDGHVRCATDPRAIGNFIGDRVNVTRALSAGAFAVGGYSIARGIGHAILTFGQPLKDADGAYVGVVTALLDIAWLDEFLKRKPLPGGTVILIADRNGTVLARTPPLTDVIGAPLPDRLHVMLKGNRRTTAEIKALDGILRVMAYSSLETGAPDMMIMVGIDKSAALAPTDAALWRIMELFIGVLALCYAGMAWGVRHLVRLRERLVLALKSGGAGSFDLDLRTGTAVWSEETFRIFGLDPLQDRSCYETWKTVLHPEDRERVIRERQAAIDAREAEHHMEYRVVHPDGTVRWVATVGRTISNPDGTPVRVSGLHIDITRRKEVEAALQAAKSEAERANLAKTKFLAAASHDLRQPMQSMFMFAAALHPHVTSERGRNALTMLERGLDTMKGLLDSLLDVSRLDAGVLRPAIEDFPIRPVLDHIGASYQPVAAAKGLELQVGATCDTVVRSDPNLLGRMVRNLVENAIRYTEVGYVRLTCHVVNGHARIAVHDTGIGIPPAHLDRVFDEFHQLGNPERDRSQGLGLGLSIVQRLSRLLGHPVTVQSEPGRGSVFSIDVTLGKAPSLLDNQPGAIVPRDGEGRLAVLVDDDAIVLLGLRAIFQDWKYQTLIAASAEQAVERLKSDGRIPDIIIADYRLRGGERGTDAVRRIRDLLGVAVPAIILTGETGMEWQREAADLGYGIAFKPVTPRQLHDVLRRYLGEAA